jgi:aminoglycoside phosphotransferase family enzyme/predicted kinase
MGESGLSIKELLRPAAFPHAVTHLHLRETHISWIVLTGRYAYKIKKPVRFSFLDASTLERRQWLCDEELRLNRRFAPDLYVDIVPITSGAGNQLFVGGDGVPVEYAVRMHEFDPTQELSSLLHTNGVSEHDVMELATVIADFHRSAPVAAASSPYGTYQAVSKDVLDNLAELRQHILTDEEAQTFDAVARWTEDQLARLEPAIRARRAAGAVRECHGDLHARNIVRWRERFTPYDCIEFDPAMRWIDVLSDLGFLFMDIAAHARADLAFACLSRYLEQTGDYAGLQVLPFYAVYRALVRAKVDALAAETADSASAQALHARLAGRLGIATRLIADRRPALIVTHGVTASGKSWLSDRLIGVLHAVRVRSDLERKRMQHVAPTAQRGAGVLEGPYAASATDLTYARLLDCADAALRAGFNAIVDATFLREAERARFGALAQQLGCDFLIVSCRADRAALKARLESRARSGLDPSEATRAVLEHQLATQEPLTGRERAQSLEVDTSWLTSADVGIQAIREKLAANRLV